MFEKLRDLFREQEEPKPNKFTLYMGDAIKQAREEAGMSQEELAEMIYRRRATLSDIETGKADVDAGTLWLLSAYLSYFYPDYARENMRPEEMGALEHELQMHFLEIKALELQKLAIQVVKVISKFEVVDLMEELLPHLETLKNSKAKRKARSEKYNKKK